MMRTSKKENSGTKNYEWFTKFYNICWSQKESFSKDLYTSGEFERNFCSHTCDDFWD